MSISTEITRLENAKIDISAAITEKGVSVPSGTMLDGMAALIGNIQTGGGEDVMIDFSSGGAYATVYYTKTGSTTFDTLPVSTLAGTTVAKDSFVCVVFGVYGTGTVTSNVGEVYPIPNIDNRVCLVKVHQSGYISW